MLRCAAGAEQETPSCAGEGATLTFDVPIPEAVYHYDKNVNAIQYLMRDNGFVFAGLDRSWTTGVTLAKVAYTLGGEFETVPADGGACVRLSSIRASFGYDRVDVYIGSDFKPGTCAFKAVYDHEYQHVIVNGHTMEEYAKRVKGALQSLADAERAIFVTGETVSADAALALYRERLEAALKDFNQVQFSRNAAMDTPQNYDRMIGQCSDWNQSYSWPRKEPVQRAPAESPPRDGSRRRPVQRAPADPAAGRPR
jgi:hypothetical protein